MLNVSLLVSLNNAPTAIIILASTNAYFFSAFVQACHSLLISVKALLVAVSLQLRELQIREGGRESRNYITNAESIFWH